MIKGLIVRVVKIYVTLPTQRHGTSDEMNGLVW